MPLLKNKAILLILTGVALVAWTGCSSPKEQERGSESSVSSSSSASESQSPDDHHPLGLNADLSRGYYLYHPGSQSPMVAVYAKKDVNEDAYLSLYTIFSQLYRGKKQSDEVLGDHTLLVMEPGGEILCKIYSCYEIPDSILEGVDLVPDREQLDPIR